MHLDFLLLCFLNQRHMQTDLESAFSSFNALTHINSYDPLNSYQTILVMTHNDLFNHNNLV